MKARLRAHEAERYNAKVVNDRCDNSRKDMSTLKIRAKLHIRRRVRR